MKRGWNHLHCDTGRDRRSRFCLSSSFCPPLSTGLPGPPQTALGSDRRTLPTPPQWLGAEIRGSWEQGVFRRHRQGHQALTEICRVVICGAVKTQVLQIWNEVRDCALVYALTLTEDVELMDEQKRRRVINTFQHTASPETWINSRQNNKTGYWPLGCPAV